MKSSVKRVTSVPTLREVYLATEEANITAFKDGIGPTDLHRRYLPHLSLSSTSKAMQELFLSGYLQETTLSHRTKRKYVITDKALPITSISSTPEERLNGDINALIESLETMQDVIPGVLAKLLDLSRAFDQLKKIKEVLSGVTSLTKEV